MSRLTAWLTGEIAHVRGLAIRRWHLHGLALLLIGLIVGLVLGFAAGYHYPYRTVAPPKIPAGQTIPNCGTNPNDHSLGSCLPAPKSVNQASITSSSQGPDFSNNNPVLTAAAWDAIAKHNAFAIFKVTEGVQFVDSKAKEMAAFARARHLVVGGYDFLHICLVSPTDEASRFVTYLKVDGLIGAGTLPPTGDVEYGGNGCNARAWLLTWAMAVHAAVGRWPELYTGAWFWNPHFGSWWPSSLILSWVSGYVSWASLPIPAGLAHVDLWQFSDRGYNGATTADLSIWRDGAKAFAAATLGTPPKLVDRYAIYLHKPVKIGGAHLVEATVVKAWDQHGCRNPVRRGVCRQLRRELVLLEGRIDRVAHRDGHVDYRADDRGKRRAGIHRRLIVR